jgi:LmbE family N-acetylglucosaminyl deacetylase
MTWVYLSPHLDDVVFSCGGLISDQTGRGENVEIWTLFAGDPPEGEIPSFAMLLHKVWDAGSNPVQVRREEDLKACRILGAEPVHFSIPDCIYRRSRVDGTPLYPGEEALFGGWDAEELSLLEELTYRFEINIPNQARIVVPLGIGNHVDHALTRQAARRLDRELIYYADYPYSREETGKMTLQVMRESREWDHAVISVSERGLFDWQRASGAYRSQISTFWLDEETLFNEIETYSLSMGGVTLWKQN